MKKICIWILAIYCCMFLTSCTAYNNINTQQVKKFRKQITSDYKQINEVKVRYAQRLLEFNYTSSKDITEKDIFYIFRKTKLMVLDENFQKDFFSFFFSKYKKSSLEEKVFPTIYIQFDINNDEKFEYQFYSWYYKEPYNSGKKNEVDGYKTWRYWDFINAPKLVPETK